MNSSNNDNNKPSRDDNNNSISPEAQKILDKIFSGMNATPSHNDETVWNDAAKPLRAAYVAFISSGFTESQAFTLTQMIFNRLIASLGGNSNA